MNEKYLLRLQEDLRLKNFTQNTCDDYYVIRQIIWSRFRQFIWMCSQVQIAYWSG